MVRTFVRTVLKLILCLVFLVVILLVVFNITRFVREKGNPAHVPHAGYQIDTVDARMYVQDVGAKSARVVVLIHGTGTWGEIWHETVTPLSKAGYRVITIDMPPFGYSEKLADSEQYSRDKQAQRILNVLTKLKISRAIIVGHSVGARPTLEAVLMSPETFEKVVLIDPALGLDPGYQDKPVFVGGQSALMRLLLQSPIVRTPVLSAYGTNPLFIERMFSSFVSKKEAITEARVGIIKQPMSIKNTTHAYGEWLKNLSASEDNSLGADFDNLAKLKMPILYIWGETDNITPLWQGKALQSVTPNSKLVIIPEVGHIPYIENVGEFNKHLLDFLK